MVSTLPRSAFALLAATMGIAMGCSSSSESKGAAGGGGAASTSASSSGGAGSASASSSSSSGMTSASSSTGSGQVNQCGAPSSPAWLAGHAVNEWFAIPGTAGAGGLNVTAYSGMALREATSEIVIAATGGHHDGNDNSVISLPLAVDAPTWVTRKGPSQVPADNVSHYADGTPSSRHLYHSIHVIESLHRVFCSAHSSRPEMRIPSRTSTRST